MNYFNKALEQFETNIVTPIYYVFFTSATILASVALFQGFTDSTNKELASLFCGFITIFIGVFLLNSTNGCASSNQSNGQHQALPTDEPGRISFAGRGRVSQGAASFNISDFEDDSSTHELHQSFPMRERRHTIDFEKEHTLSHCHTFVKPRLSDSVDSDDGCETTEVPSSSSHSNSSGNYAPASPASLTHDDVHIDIPLSPMPLSGRRQSMPFGKVSSDI
ncbi:hypothetical protein LPJ66_007813 [Kickxella alabastrina]|uniref:Uncharacterized protein n=1 Tax=Kickxella alabastrina TaxID=61397 RepID=A0ACC1IG54_9FUNG|nr:hypothetical protein LPJ66_007813 [Kickxella alabastrina]